MGYRPGGGVAGVLGGWLLTVIAGWSLAWIFTWFGTVARSAQAVQGISMMIMFPLTFLSNAFVPADTLPELAADLRQAQPGQPRRHGGARPDGRRRGHHRGRPGRWSAARRSSRCSCPWRCARTPARCEGQAGTRLTAARASGSRLGAVRSA